MAIRDLEYPSDADKVFDNLISGLEYDAAYARLGADIKDIQIPESTGIRFGGPESRANVMRDASGLFSRSALISMIVRIEEFNRLLLLQRYVLEELKDGRRMTSQPLWAILKKVSKNIREKSSTEVVTTLLVLNPSAELVGNAKWLDSLTKVRNCLAHRSGKVQIDDVKPKGTSLESVQDNDVLRAHWLRVKAAIGGKHIQVFPHTTDSSDQLEVGFEEYEREWKIGDVIHISPDECQGIALSLSLLGRRTIGEFKAEMNKVLGLE